MTRDMQDSLALLADREAATFDREHPGDESAVYRRAVGARRVARLAAAGAAAVVAASALVVGGLLLSDVRALEPADTPPVPVVELVAFTPALESLDPVEDPGRAAAEVRDEVRAALEAGGAGCLALLDSDPAGTMRTLHGAYEAWGAVTAVHAARYPTADAARARVQVLERDGRGCADSLTDGDGLLRVGAPVTATATSTAFAGVPGKGASLTFATPDQAGELGVLAFAADDVVLTVVRDRISADHASEIIQAYLGRLG